MDVLNHPLNLFRTPMVCYWKIIADVNRLFHLIFSQLNASFIFDTYRERRVKQTAKMKTASFVEYLVYTSTIIFARLQGTVIRL